MDTKLSRYAAVAERVFVDRYEQACPVGQVVISRWEPRWEVRVSFLTRDVAEAFAKALQEAKAPTESPFSKVRESAARLGETIAEWDAKFGNKPPNAKVSGAGMASAGLPGVRRLSTEKEMDGRILTCVYCGHAYPQDTPAHGSQVLTDHIRVCEKHPMRKAEADIAMLRAALVGLIGVDGEDELRQMEATMRLLPAPDADKAVSINAIHALLATVPPNA